MTGEEISILLIIGLSFLGGSIFGSIMLLLLGCRRINELEEEVDKFRELYFREVDKYTDDDPNHELEP